MFDRSPVKDAIHQWRRADAREAVAPPDHRMWDAIEAKERAALAIAYAKPESLEDQRAKLLWAWRRLRPFVENADANPDQGPGAIKARRVLRRVIAAMREGRTLPHAARDLREAALAIEPFASAEAQAMHPRAGSLCGCHPASCNVKCVGISTPFD